MQTILYVTAEVLRIVAIMAQPFLPASMEKLLGLLGVPANARKFANAEIAQGLVAGTPLPTPSPVFPRYINAEEDLLPGGQAC
jgi:methionyl-tRNA synthetase